MSQRRLKVFFDGGCRPNPGRIEVAVVARGVAHVHDDLGHGTHNDAEWLALIHALMLGQTLGQPFDLIGDAALVIDQAKGVGRCHGTPLQHHLERFTMLAAPNPPARIRWIGRAQNLAGIALARRHGR
jgi:ribonuclease HI